MNYSIIHASDTSSLELESVLVEMQSSSVAMETETRQGWLRNHLTHAQRRQGWRRRRYKVLTSHGHGGTHTLQQSTPPWPLTPAEG